MNSSTSLATTVMPAAHSNPRSPLARYPLLLTIAFTCCFLGVTAFAKQPPDGDQGNGNTAEGNGALNSNTTGPNNTADGFQTLFKNATGGANTATGAQALFNNTNASGNTADGFLALFSNTTGAANTATGSQALNFSTVGNENTATGSNSLFNNTTGNDNVANGANAGHNNTTGSFNTTNGATTLYFNSTGSFNTADGSFALNLCTGSSNIALGYAAGINLTTGDGNIDIGNQGVADESVTIRIGTQGTQQAAFMAGVFGTPVAGVNVVVDANGQLGTLASSERFKRQIKPMDKTSEALFALRPVSYRYQSGIDPTGAEQFGLVAEEVAKVNPALVARYANGKIYTVRYEAVNAMLLNEFLKEHRKVKDLETKLAQQQIATAAQRDAIKALTANLKDQASQIQQVKTELRLGKPSTQVAGNTP
ncbi:MAG: tail fiber domain-containing protein [Verrucomicrobiota bacterium]